MELPKDITNFKVVSHKELPGGLITRIYKHLPSSILFQIIEKGTFQLGFSELEEEALRDSLFNSNDDDSEAGLAFLESLNAFRPLTRVTIEPFLLAQNPLTQSQIEALLGEIHSTRSFLIRKDVFQKRFRNRLLSP